MIRFLHRLVLILAMTVMGYAVAGAQSTLTFGSATLTASPAAYTGACPGVITFTATIVLTDGTQKVLTTTRASKYQKPLSPIIKSAAAAPIPVDSTCAAMLPPMTEGSMWACCRFLRSDGTVTPPRLVELHLGPNTITDTWSVPGPASGWEQLVLFSPAEHRSNQASFTVDCK